MNNTIVCLTRGYNSLVEYDKLIKRNMCIKKCINKNLDYPKQQELLEVSLN